MVSYSRSKTISYLGKNARIIVDGDDNVRAYLNGQEVLDFDIHASPIYKFNVKGKPICGVVNPKTGNTCLSTNRIHTGRCKRHSWTMGEAQISRIKNAYIRTMPSTLLADHARVMKNSNLLSVRKDVGWMEVRLSQLREKLNEALDPEAWEALRRLSAEAFGLLLDHIHEDDPERFGNVVRKMCYLIENGGEEYKIWDEIEKITKTKAALSRQEHVMLKDLAGMVPKEQVASLMTYLTRVTEARLAAILTGSAELTGDPRVRETMNLIAMDVARAVDLPSRQDMRVINGIPLIPIIPTLVPEKSKP